MNHWLGLQLLFTVKIPVLSSIMPLPMQKDISSEAEELNLSVTYLGYKKKTLPVAVERPMIIRLLPEAITLKEVTIRGGRISMRQDTVKYDLARFASSKDSNVKDVLKKLPGIDVDEQSGRISYQGKAISHFYVEGMDVTGGSYNQVNENLKADAVESAEIIERHQPIRSLRNKVPTENIALNLKLKPEVRSKWIWNSQIGMGYGNEALYDVRLNALQLAKGKHGLYTYKADHSGKDLTTELQQLTSNDVHQPDEVPSLIGSPNFSMPLEKHRLLDNDTHLLSLNRIYRKDEIQQSRLSFRYLHDEQHRKQGTEEAYHYPSDTIRNLNNQGHRLHNDLLRADWDYEMNGEQSFTRNVLTVQGKRTDAVSEIQGDYDLTQHIQTDQMEVENRFNTIYNKDNHTWGFRSYLHYTYLPSFLEFDEIPQEIDLHQAYTDNQFYYLRKRNGFGIELTSGVNGRMTIMKQQTNFKAHRLQIYAHPIFRWERNNFRIAATPSVTWNRLPNQQVGKVYFNPWLNVQYRLSSRWTVRASAGVRHQTETPEYFYPTGYYTDHRTFVQMKEEVGNIQNQSYIIYTEYKRPAKEFFWTLTLGHFNTQKDYMTHTEYQGKKFILTSFAHRNRAETYQASTLFSKGIYDWNMKTSLEATYNYYKGKQAGEGIIQSYENHWVSLQPKVSWSPDNLLSLSYQASINCNQTRIGTPLSALWDIKQRLSLSIGSPYMNLNVGGEHYYTELSADESKNTWLADISFQHAIGKWQWKVSLTNLFNQEEYRYTSYSDISSYTSWIKIRPRECMFSVQYKW